MPLADQILALRSRMIADLNAAHDYYAHSRAAWDVMEQAIAGGYSLNLRNAQTGTLTTEAELPTLAEVYVSRQLAEMPFQSFVSVFENFLFDFLGLWLTAYPQNLGNKQTDLKTILELRDVDLILQIFVRKELNEILYKPPAGWFAYLDEKVKLGLPTADEIARIAEAKATRDVLVHNSGVAGPEYARKAGPFARFGEGERVEIPTPYHREIWTLFRNVASDICDSAVLKLPA